MARGARTSEEYDREAAEVFDRQINRGRDFINALEADDWEGFVRRNIADYYGYEATESQLEFFERSRAVLEDLFAPGSQLTFHSGIDTRGREYALFYDHEARRITSLEHAKEFVRGVLRGF